MSRDSAPASSPAAGPGAAGGSAAPAERLGRYRLLGLLGRGAMGEVWLAEDEATPGRRRVAVKALRGALAGDEDALRRFAREVDVLARLDHPGIVRALGPLEQAGEARFYAMELVLGRTLDALLRAGGPLEPAHAARLASELVLALAAAHEQGVVHRDVKPSNVLVDRDGRPRLSDFGLARAADRSRWTAASTVLGTPAYMSPEQARGDEATASSDLYAAGALLFELVAGRPPFVAESPVALLRMHLDEPPPDLRALVPGVPPELAACVARALAKSPADRYPDARAMARALDAVVPGSASAAVATTVVLRERVLRLEPTTSPSPATGEGAAASGDAAPATREGAAASGDAAPAALVAVRDAAAPVSPTPRPADRPASPGSTRPRRRRTWIVAGLAAGVVLVGLGSHGAPPPAVDPPAAAPPPPVAPAAEAAPGEPVTVVLRSGGRLEAWLVAFDRAAGRVECVERATRRARSLPRAEVLRIEHAGGERGDAPR